MPGKTEPTKPIETLQTGVLQRNYTIDRAAVDEEKRTVELSFSSETPIKRWFGLEILGHDKKEVDLSWIGSGRAPLLLGHWSDDHIGVVEKATIGADRKGRAVVRFGKSRQADEAFLDVVDGIKQNVSVGYKINKMRLEAEDEKKGATYRAIDWRPIEISIVTVPADEKVGIGRSRDDRQHATQIIRRDDAVPPPADNNKKGADMPEKAAEKTRAAAPAAPAEIDIEKLQRDTRAAEQGRISNIMALGAMHNMQDDAVRAVEDGKSLDQFRAFVLEEMGKRGYKPVEHGADIGLTGKESRQFSFLRAINALANPTDRGAQEAAAFEFECSRAVSERMKRTPQGIMVPFEVLKRDLNVTTDAEGGYFVSTDLMSANFIDALRAKMMTQTLGAIVLGGLVGDVAIPKLATGATAYWVAESGAPTESTQAVGQLPLTPKTVGAFTDLSRKFIKQSSIDAEAFVRNDLAAVCALALDAAGIAGTGAGNQPTGILSTTGIGDVICGDPDGAAPTWATVVGLETEVAVDNADIGSLAYLTNAKARGTLKQTEKATNTAQFCWENPAVPGEMGMCNGYRAAASNQVPSDLTKGIGTALSAIIFGNWSDLVYGMWGTVDILVDPYTGSTAGTVRVVALQDADVGVRHAESFAAAQDAVTT